MRGQGDMTDTTSAINVAAYLLKRKLRMNKTKLQKLVVKCQDVSLRERGVPMFSESIRAWRHGPVVKELWMRGSKFPPHGLSPEQQIICDQVLDRIGNKTAEQLTNMTHRWLPWEDARSRGDNEEITIQSMIDWHHAQWLSERI
jgi:uncharacterized phage-associated protein